MSAAGAKISWAGSRLSLPLTIAIRIYQWTIRPLIGSNCRFHPSCSEYAIEALEIHGVWRGALLAGWRILRCNPWAPGGWDPVPPCPHHHNGSLAKGSDTP
jgi:putative membrane protein insertion efficiency factor